MIGAGSVLVNGSPAKKSAHQVLPGDAVVLEGPGPRFVGRGGEKLQAALDTFCLDPSGSRCLDVGSSTGGFTDCLLQAGAAHVVAVDVGTHQLHERLRGDARVDVREQTDIRAVDLESVGARFDFVVCDVSFIGLDAVMPTMLELLDDFGFALVLVKPQFEAGRAEVSKGRGVISDPEVWRRVLVDYDEMVTGLGASVADGIVSPIKGGSGNVEFMTLVRRWADEDQIDIEALVADATHL